MSTVSFACRPWSVDWLQPTMYQLLKQYISYGRDLYAFRSNTRCEPHALKSDNVPQIPPELVRIVLLHLLTTSPHTFTQALRVSRTWAEVGIPLLWKDISLDLAQIDTFTQSLALSSYSAQHINSLTLRLNHTGQTDIQLKNLSEQLPRLQNLTTFSFSLTSVKFGGVTTISDLLRALPKSVTSLEICSLPQGSNHSHQICSTLRGILPRLEHLRIDRGNVCGDILPDQSGRLPRLKTVLINDSSRSYISLRQCKPIASSESRTDLCAEEIALKARHLIDAGCMPSIESFVVLTSCPCSPGALQDLALAAAAAAAATDGASRPLEAENPVIQNSQYFLKKNALTNKTTAYLHCPIPHNPRIRAMRYYDPEKADNPHILGAFQDLKAVLEKDEPGAWIQATSSGARFPPSVRDSQQSRSRGYVWNGPAVWTAFDPWAPGSENVRALGEEALNPFTYDGLRKPFATI